MQMLRHDCKLETANTFLLINNHQLFAGGQRNSMPQEFISNRQNQKKIPNHLGFGFDSIRNSEMNIPSDH